MSYVEIKYNVLVVKLSSIIKDGIHSDKILYRKKRSIIPDSPFQASLCPASQKNWLCAERL